jgi:hypothetical protein
VVSEGYAQEELELCGGGRLDVDSALGLAAIEGDGVATGFGNGFYG